MVLVVWVGVGGLGWCWLSGGVLPVGVESVVAVLVGESGEYFDVWLGVGVFVGEEVDGFDEVAETQFGRGWSRLVWCW